MQLPTHILAGVIIQKAFDWRKCRPLELGLTAVVAFLSHGLLDKVSNITYHPPKADFGDSFWIGYHFSVLVFTILFFYLWWREFKWGIFFAILPDLDWVFIHGQEIFHFQIPFYRRPHMHDFLGWIYRHIPGASYLDKIPSNRHNPWACLWEVALVLAMLLVIRAMRFDKSAA